MSSLAVAQRSKPRVRRAPQASSNDVDDAVFLSSRYGLTPDDWQEDILESWLGRRANGRWAAATCGLAVPRQNGKNALIEMRELFGMVGEGEKFLHTAHEVKTARKAFLRIASFFENERDYPELAALVKDIRKTNGQEAVVLTNGGSVEFIARSKGSGRGFTVDVLVCDEAQDLADEELAALLPTISAAPRGNPQLIVTGTPPKRGKGLPFRRIREDGEAGRDARLAWTDFGVPDGPMPDVENRALWVAHNPGEGSRLSLDEMEREFRVLSPEDFAAERLGWWGDPQSEIASVIDLKAWATLADDETRAFPPPPQAVLVVDVAPDRKRASIGVAGVAPDGRTLLLVTTAPGTAWVVPEVARLVAERDVLEVAVQPTSQAGALIPELVTAGVEFHPLTATHMGQACAGFIKGVTEKRWAHLGQHELDAAVGNARTRYSGEAELWDRRDRSVDISPLVAVSAAAHRWGVLNANYDVLASVY